MTTGSARDHGGGIDAATARFGKTRADGLNLSTGIKPVPCPVPVIVIDNSRRDVMPAASPVRLVDRRVVIILRKCFGKFWGLAGLRRKFAIDDRARLAGDVARLGRRMVAAGMRAPGGTILFRLCHTDDAHGLQERLLGLA